MSELLRFVNNPPRHVPVTEPGYYDGKDFYPFACPTCSGSGRDLKCDGICKGQIGDYCPCPDCIDGRNPALIWAEWCTAHGSVLWGGGDHGAIKRCEWTTDEKPYHMHDCTFRWVAIGVAE